MNELMAGVISGVSDNQDPVQQAVPGEATLIKSDLWRNRLHSLTAHPYMLSCARVGY